MCGIAGILSCRPLNEGWNQNLSRMADTLIHRGPDDFGYFWEGLEQEAPRQSTAGGKTPRVAFAHRRLSILDLSEAARQPMARLNGKLFLTYNGEIYNFQALREELKKRGSVFRTQSDTEVLLEAYRAWGIDCVKKLRGIFAFALADLDQNRVFLVRDPLGVKPLYYMRLSDALHFASEMKTFLQIPDFRPQADASALRQYLHFLWIPGSQTGLQQVCKLDPGTILTFDLSGGKTRQQTYWSPFSEAAETETVSEKESIERLRRELSRAVGEQLVSDVPLGAFLSGGLDSSLVAALMGPAKTFSVGYSKKDLAYDIVPDDLPFAKKISQTLCLQNEAMVLSPDVASVLPKVVWNLDEPIGDPAAVSSYLICEAAKKNGLTVMLSGVGGDELFAGYPRQKALRYAQFFRRWPNWMQTITRTAAGFLPGAGKSTPAKVGRALKKFLNGVGHDPLHHYIMMESYFPFGAQSALIAADGPLNDGLPEWNAEYKKIIGQIREGWNQTPLFQAILLDLVTYLPCLNLAYTDKTSMAHGIEVRVPLLDIEVVRSALHQPERRLLKWRHAKLEGKWLLKKAAEPFLPKEIVWRKKAGFGAPVRSWLRHDLREMRKELLGQNGLGRRGWFLAPALRKLEAEFETGREDHALKLWMLMSLELWARQYLDRKM